MAGYLEGYGVDEARRGRLIKRIVLSLIGLVIVGTALYFQFRNFPEERQFKRFRQFLESRDYEGAYRLWGCTLETPCRDYAFDRFLEDWGPKSPHASLANLKIETTRSCDAGLIQIWDFGKDEKAFLYVRRADKTLSFAPFEFCNPRFQAPASP